MSAGHRQIIDVSAALIFHDGQLLITNATQMHTSADFGNFPAANAKRTRRLGNVSRAKSARN